MALLIPILALCIPFFAIWTAHKRSMAKMQLSAGAGPNAQISSETAWAGSGGGVSTFSQRPAWQTGTGVPAGAINPSQIVAS